MNRDPAHSLQLDRIIKQYSREPQVWEQPDLFDLSSWADQQEVARRFESGDITTTIDRQQQIAEDVFAMRFPELASDKRAEVEYVNTISEQGIGYGQWANFKWKKTLERYPEKDDYQDLRTFRNKNLITHGEQSKLLSAKVAVFGLSVGSNIVDQLSIGGIGGTMIMGDFDTLSPTNLNRIRSTMAQVGMSKLDIAACKISEIDPYVQQVHFRHGITEDSLSSLAEIRPDVIFDEVDDLAAKIMLRHFAKTQKIPLVMATDLGDISILDVERHDVEIVKPFAGRVSERELGRVATTAMTDNERQKIMMKIVSVRHITPRMLHSAMEVGKTLGGLPQLGSTAATGGALAAVAAREILLGRTMKSGRYISSSKRLLKSQGQMSFTDSVRTVGRFIRSHR